MKPVIIIAIAFVLFISTDVFAQDNEPTNNFVRNGTDVVPIEEFHNALIPNTTVVNRIQNSDSNTFFFWIIGIVVSAGFLLLGFYLGKRESNKQLGLFLKALNIERVIKDMEDPRLFMEDGTVKGSGKFTAGISVSGNVINLKDKKMITEDGIRDMTPEEIEKYGKKSPA